MQQDIQTGQAVMGDVQSSIIPDVGPWSGAMPLARTIREAGLVIEQNPDAWVPSFGTEMPSHPEDQRQALEVP